MKDSDSVFRMIPQSRSASTHWLIITSRHAHICQYPRIMSSKFYYPWMIPFRYIDPIHILTFLDPIWVPAKWCVRSTSTSATFIRDFFAASPRCHGFSCTWLRQKIAMKYEFTSTVKQTQEWTVDFHGLSWTFYIEILYLYWNVDIQRIRLHMFKVQMIALSDLQFAFIWK